MGGWMFFSSDNSRRNWSLEDFLEDLPSLGRQASRDEWHEHVPESRERTQGRSLGFFCGGAKASRLLAELPAYPMSVFVSDLTIMPVCWTYKTVLEVSPASLSIYKFNRPHAFRSVLTVTGTFADQPPYLRVCGSYSFFPPPYRLAKGDAGKK